MFALFYRLSFIPGIFPIPIPDPPELYIFSDNVISASVFPPLIVPSAVYPFESALFTVPPAVKVYVLPQTIPGAVTTAD